MASRAEILELSQAARAALADCATARFAHRLGGHPALTYEAVVDLADRVPRPWTCSHFADHAADSLECAAVEDDPGEVARTIATNNARLTIFRLEHAETYRRMLDGCIGQIAPLLPDVEGKPRRREVAVFLAGPRGGVPAHFDLHHNILLQVEGTKEVGVGSFGDPSETARRVDEGFDVGHRLGELPPQSAVVRLGPGDGLFIPAYAVHWVCGGDDRSIALSLGFSTDRTDRRELVHRANNRLRRCGLRPHPPGRRPSVDRAKAGAYQWARLVRRRLRPPR